MSHRMKLKDSCHHQRYRPSKTLWTCCIRSTLRAGVTGAQLRFDHLLRESKLHHRHQNRQLKAPVRSLNQQTAWRIKPHWKRKSHQIESLPWHRQRRELSQKCSGSTSRWILTPNPHKMSYSQACSSASCRSTPKTLSRRGPKTVRVKWMRYCGLIKAPRTSHRNSLTSTMPLQSSIFWIVRSPQ